MIKQIAQKIWAYKIRKLINGDSAENNSEPTDLTIHTKCPSKWILIDLETGQMYRGLKNPDKWGKWKRLRTKLTSWTVSLE